MTLRPTMLLALAGLGLAQQAVALSWVGNTSTWLSGQAFPKRGGYLEPWQSMTVTAETWPIETGQRLVAVVTTTNWASSQEYEFTWERNVGNNSRWFVNIGPFPQGTQVNFFLRGTRTGQTNPIIDNNSGANYGYHQRFASPYKRGAILQWFETDYKTIMRRLPEVIEAGYSSLYLPSPTKSGGGGFSVGYNPVDRFDLGDRLQKGSVRTKYGTTQELQELIQVAKRFGIDVYVDLVINHNDNRASHPINRYPDMIPEDFHIRSSADTGNTEINFNVESPFSFGMLNHDLVGLVDIAHEDGNNTRTGAFTYPSYVTQNVWGKPSFVRNPLTPQYYLDGTPRGEDVREYLERWSKWLISVIGIDGFRVDAVKHVGPGYFGWAPDQAASQGFSNGDLLSRLFSFDPSLYVFGEVYSSNSYELREYGKTGFHLLDFPLKFKMGDVFNSNGFANLGQALGNTYGYDPATGLAFLQGGLGPDTSVSFVQSHDDGPPTSNNLAYAFMLARPGRPKVYYDGNNIQPNAWTNFPRPGRGDSLGNFGSTIVKMVNANERFARGYSVQRYLTANVLAFERLVNGRPIMLFAMNNNGASAQTVNIQTSYPAGTVLRDYANSQPDITVGANGVATVTIPSNGTSSEPNNGKGFVMYGRITAEAVAGQEPVVFSEYDPNRASNKSGWVTVTRDTYTNNGGTYGTSSTFKAATLRGGQSRVNVRTSVAGVSGLIKFNNGIALPGLTPLSNTPEGLSDGFIPMTKLTNGQFSLDNIDLSGLPDGLHLAKVRIFSDSGSDPGVYSDFNYFFYVRRGLSTGWKVDGDLTDFGNPLSSQSRNATSQLNRIDALYASNDDRFLYLGLAGRVDGAENMTNGMAAFIDVDGANGVRDVSTLNDDSGPAARLLSNTRLTLPTGFGADFAFASFRNSSMHSSPEAPFAGGLRTAPLIGAQAALYRINPLSLNWLESRPAVIATQIRPNKFDPPKGVEIAIPLTELFSTPGSANTGLNILAYHATTGEQDAFLTSTDPLRATLGGRPAATSWLSNQLMPTQVNILSDPGTAQFTALQSLRINLNMAVAQTNGFQVTPGAITLNGATGRFEQTVTIANQTTAALKGPLKLRVQVPSGVQVVNALGRSVLVHGGFLQLAERGLNPGSIVTIKVEYSAPNLAAITPTLMLFSGKGAL